MTEKIKTKNNYYLIGGLCWITFLVGTTWANIGQSFEAGVYGYEVLWSCIIIVGFTFMIGFFAGEEKKYIK